MRSTASIEHSDLFKCALDMELALIGLHSRLQGIHRHADGSAALIATLSADALVDVERALFPSSASASPRSRTVPVVAVIKDRDIPPALAAE